MQELLDMLRRRAEALQLGSGVAGLPSRRFTSSRRVSPALSLTLRLKYFCRRGIGREKNKKKCQGWIVFCLHFVICV